MNSYIKIHIYNMNSSVMLLYASVIQAVTTMLETEPKLIFH